MPWPVRLEGPSRLSAPSARTFRARSRGEGEQFCRGSHCESTRPARDGRPFSQRDRRSGVQSAAMLLRRLPAATLVLLASLGAVRDVEARPHPEAGEVFQGAVVGVSDGDSLTVMREGRGVKVRLFGVDCPESRQPFGYKAKQFTAALAFGRTVVVTVRDQDRYHRFVAEIRLADGTDVGRELVRVGLAWWYERYAKEDRVLERLQAAARARQTGLWSDPKAVPPWEFRRARREARAAKN